MAGMRFPAFPSDVLELRDVREVPGVHEVPGGRAFPNGVSRTVRVPVPASRRFGVTASFDRLGPQAGSGDPDVSRSVDAAGRPSR
ncbi:hypothetical protein G9272_06325 [Streptomyces asoensis]|uniref:Uncharacterized protein n=1 Tax=Streptomyces asoensis TaxID=249586 RepID=A0A6M4WPY1_9ACTN|nr:hypothetical protein [Streptomyces asoensis]QJS99945.1 hypothetical protein G9272_06325 [Streptomyces asoensis]